MSGPPLGAVLVDQTGPSVKRQSESALMEVEPVWISCECKVWAIKRMADRSKNRTALCCVAFSFRLPECVEEKMGEHSLLRADREDSSRGISCFS